MLHRVHILATVRKPELLPAALLIFRTLRTGFPAGVVQVWGNALDLRAENAVHRASEEAGARFINVPATVHDQWIENLLQSSLEPFWILDTDVLFWESIEAFEFPKDCFLAGRFEPEFDEESTSTRHMERLHTALMWFNPALLRAAMRAWMARIPAPWGHTGDFPFVLQHFVPLRGSRPRFYDTCAGLWHAGLGTPFTEPQNDAFDHLHCATYIDLIGPRLSVPLRQAHEAIYADHTIAKGMRHQQAKYYAQRQPTERTYELRPGNN
jgi:hypothetical protein